MLALLWTTPTVALSGDGVGYVQTELVTQDELPPVFQITVLDAVPGEDLPLNVAIDYQNGISETIKFVIVGRYTAWIPFVARSSGGEATLKTQSPRGIQAHWGPWVYHWAGTHDDQRLYNQFTGSPNTSDCVSGCGATGWAMLFGWADQQAWLGRPDWAHRSGIYRSNGSLDGSPGANAPRTMNTGVTNMTWEIRNDIDTYCVGDSGLTWPRGMGDAYLYLAPRTGARSEAHYVGNGHTLIKRDWLRDRAIRSIRDRGTPVILGRSFHYPLAYGYAYRHRYSWSERWIYRTQRRFYVNQGWGGSDNGWLYASTWFSGEIYP